MQFNLFMAKVLAKEQHHFCCCGFSCDIITTDHSCFIKFPAGLISAKADATNTALGDIEYDDPVFDGSP